MRILLGWVVLLGLCIGAGLLQRHWTGRLHAERSEAVARGREGGAGRGSGARRAGWDRIVVGRPSAAAPIDVPLPPRRGARAGARPEARGEDAGPAPLEPVPAGDGSPPSWSGDGPPPGWTPPVFELTVQSGQVLSRICQDFYGTARPSLVQAVAEWNGLASPDSLRAGRRLELPDRGVLGL